MVIRSELINKLMSSTKQMILDNKSSDNTINNFKKRINSIEALLISIIDDQNKTEDLQSRREKILELQMWLNDYQEYMDECRLILDRINSNPNYSEQGCLNLIRYVTLYQELESKIDYNNVLYSKISNLHNILEKINEAYHAVFNVNDDLISRDSLPVKKTNDVTDEEYQNYVSNFFSRKKSKKDVLKENIIEDKKVSEDKKTPLNISVVSGSNDGYLLRKRNLDIYKNKLYKKMDEFKGQIHLFNQQSLELQTVLTSEINRVQNITEDDLKDLKKDLKIFNPSTNIETIMQALIARYHINPLTYTLPVLTDKELDVLPVFEPTNDKKNRNYKNKGSLKKQVNFGETILAALKYLGFNEVDIKDKKAINEHVDYDMFINIGDVVNLKDYNVYVYKDVNLKIPQIPLYGPETTRYVEKLYMTNNENVVEVTGQVERNYYLEFGYKPFAIKCFDGYYKVSDVVIVERERSML